MDIIQERIESYLCPICGEVSVDVKSVQDNKYGEVKICKKHYVQGENNES